MLKFKVIFFSLFLIGAVGCNKASAVPKAAEETAKSAASAVAPAVSTEAKQASFKPFYVYKDKGSSENHYILSGWMGDFADVVLSDSSVENPHTGSSGIKITYSPRASGGVRWAGVYWQNPANNWGSKKGGFDLTGATTLKFWARGEKGGERIEEFKIGGLTGEYPDSDTAAIGPVILTTEWKEYTIDLRGKDLSYISGGFCWATNADVNPDGATFYLDDIVYE